MYWISNVKLLFLWKIELEVRLNFSVYLSSFDEIFSTEWNKKTEYYIWMVDIII